jgi:DNA-binding CsgD family transcriptional regulator/GAF domain-containing protein
MRKSGRSPDIAALLAAARAVLENRAFADAARAVLLACKTILGADAGLVAVRAADRKGLEVALLDPGSLELSSATGLPAPLRRLSARVTKVGRIVLANDLSKRMANRPPPRRRSVAQSALLAPIVIDGDMAGLLGLINKPGGFSAADSQLAEVFAEMAAIAMLHSRTVNGLETNRNALEREVREGATQLRLAHEAERRARTMADALREAAVELTRSLDRETVLAALLDCLRRLVPFDRARVMLRKEASRVSVRAIFDGNRVVPLPAEERPELNATDHPIVHGILTTGAAVLIPDVRAYPDWSLPTESSSEASWMGVPLFARGDVAGLLSLSKREAGYFTEEHVRLAEAMSSQASVAVENAVLFEQMQASMARVQSLSCRLVDAQESERRNIARELHDEAGQALAALRFGLRLLEREIEEGGSVTGRVHRRGSTGELTRRELDVLRLLAKGNTNRQIAGLLGLSIRTVENHRANLMGKLGLVSRVELVNYAEEHNLL